MVLIVVDRHGWRCLRQLTLLAHQPDQPHAADPLDRHHKVDGTEHRPPTLAGLLHPGQAREPLLRQKWRPVTAKATGLDLEAEQPQPVAQPPVAHELTSTGQKQARLAPACDAAPHMAQALAQTPQAGRVEADHDNATFGHQNTFDFAQRKVRVAGEFQAMRQHHEVQALAVKGQGIEVAMQGHGAARKGMQMGIGHAIEMVAEVTITITITTCTCTGDKVVFSDRIAHRVGGQPAMRHSVGAQGVQFGQAELQCVEAEQVGHRHVEVALLPLQHIAARGRLQPLGQTYNRATRFHEPERPARLFLPLRPSVVRRFNRRR